MGIDIFIHHHISHFYNTNNHKFTKNHCKSPTYYILTISKGDKSKNNPILKKST